MINNQTTLIGNNSVNINVGTKTNNEGENIGEGITTITGAIIASGSYETIDTGEVDMDGNGITATTFNDNANLQLTTKELNYSDLNNFIYTKDTMQGLQTGVGFDTDKGKLATKPEGETVITYKNSASEKEGITKATIGNGNINVSNSVNGKEVVITAEVVKVLDENGNPKVDINGNQITKTITTNNVDELLADINRDVNKSQVITKDMITSASDWELHVDNRVVSAAVETTINIIEKAVEGVIDLTKSQIEKLKDALNKEKEQLMAYQVIVQGYAKAAPEGSEERKYWENRAEEVVGKLMEISQRGLDLLVDLEGLKTEAYNDSAGISTIGVGHVIKSNESSLKNGINEIDAIVILLDDVSKFENTVNNKINTNLTQNQFDALVMLAFNIGSGQKGFSGSSVMKMINDSNAKTNYSTLADAWKAWNKSGGSEVKGLVNRRNAEWKVFNDNNYGN